MYGINAFDSWLYDDNAPFMYLSELQICRFLKEQVGSRYFEDLIQTYLLDNTHASVIVMAPEKGLTQKEEERVRKELADYKATLSKEELDDLAARTKRLRAFQSTPSTEEELKAIPLLRLCDIKKETAPLYNQEISAGGATLLYHEIDTNGIAYLDLLFDLAKIPQEYIPYVGILTRVLGMVDTARHTYRDLSNEIHIHSGGISAAATAFADAANPGSFCSKLHMEGKMLYEQIDFVFDTMEEIMLTSSPEDEKRLYEIIARLKSNLQTRLVSAGHLAAATRAMSYFSGVSRFNDSVNGIALYKLVESIEEQFDSKKQDLIRILKELTRMIFCRGNLLASLTAETEAVEKVKERLTQLSEKLFPAETARARETVRPAQKNEGFETSSQVQYVALAGNFCKAGYQYTGALRILKTIMAYEYLWTNIRVQGGAYGCMSGYGRTGDVYFVSYRDPNLGKTLKVYEGIAQYLREFHVSDRDMCKYIIGTMSELDTPLNPQAKGARSLAAYLGNLTLQDLQRERDQILNATPDSIRELADLIGAVAAQRNICVIGNSSKIQAEKDLFGEIRPLVGQGEDA